MIINKLTMNYDYFYNTFINITIIRVDFFYTFVTKIKRFLHYA